MPIALVPGSDGEVPTAYLIPSTVWLEPNALFVGRDFVGKQSPPEWGINLSARNQILLDPYRLEARVGSL